MNIALTDLEPHLEVKESLVFSQGAKAGIYILISFHLFCNIIFYEFKAYQ